MEQLELQLEVLVTALVTVTLCNSKGDFNMWKQTKTLKQSKRILRFNSRSERLGYISKSSNPNCYISKFHQSLNEMLNLHGKFAKYGHKEAFTRDMVVRESVRDHR